MGTGWSAADIPDLSSTRVLVTGGNAGLGYASCVEFAKKGAEVIMTARSREKGDKAVAQIKEIVPGANLKVMMLDMAKFQSVRTFVAEFTRSYPSLNVLVNNAGIANAKDHAFVKTEDDLELCWQTNFYAPFLLTNLLMESLAQGATIEKPSRVVMISSVTLTNSINEIDPSDPEGVNLAKKKNPKTTKYFCYSNTKLADRMFSATLHDKLQASTLKGRILSVCAHPGWATTDMTSFLGNTLNALLGQPASQGCLSQVRVSVDPIVKSGDFYGPNTATRLSVQHVFGLFSPDLNTDPELYGSPIPSALQSEHVSNKELCLALWSKAEELTGAKFIV